jgi:hypothetical protein
MFPFFIRRFETEAKREKKNEQSKNCISAVSNLRISEAVECDTAVFFNLTCTYIVIVLHINFKEKKNRKYLPNKTHHTYLNMMKKSIRKQRY